VYTVIEMRRRSLIHLAGATALGTFVPERLASAESLTSAEIRCLEQGGELRVPLDLDLPQGRYFGGTVYKRLFYCSVDDVMAVAANPGTYTSILSTTQEARVISRSGRDVQVYLRHGAGLIRVSYVVRVRRESSNLLRFWLDPSEPHDLDDGWGSLRVEPLPMLFRGRFSQYKTTKPVSLVTWSVLLRIDRHDVKVRHSEAIRRLVMETPQLLDRYLQRPPRPT
jgi:hypothetical protein